ncbi:fatty acid metabolism transcriptional regulator FadR [Alteromonas oceanisediminis]|uniref:fatty acid metabolism transcriptional regulator FadR n=1 Tax=Alteromonas oceanisediminis TaxID=2836180 RepID=UPI001BDA8DFD|nr:fatty acid metabolism transcriptional regulator FadR [Alteromonas oceanisediminis]MBT0587454.1 fatty acid metabolism transcriptional regulator FadR [Alteromonas oceanisediminis]
MIYKAQSPAGFAEEYIVESIWSGRFAPGTILPAERELSELIGVTRTTLREVLQRLARDGWLTIQHGKPTKVNNFWETCGLNILETLARLDQEGIPDLIDNLLAARTNLSAVFIRGALRNNPEKSVEIISRYTEVPEEGLAFAEFDYQLNHDLALASGNPVFVLMMNGFRSMYARIGGYFFSHQSARDAVKAFYQNLLAAAEKGDYESVPTLLRRYGIESGKVWSQVRETIPSDLVD